MVQLAAIAAAGIENARLYEQLKDQDRRKDEFLATLAHELRNPLAPVRNGLQILRSENAAKADVQRVREIMERQISHLVHLVDDLLDVSRVTTGKILLNKERVLLQTVIDNALETSRPTIEAAHHQLHVELPQGNLTVDADRNRLAQVLTNLITNAAKYTPPRGAIWIRAHRAGDEVVMSVSDTGVGLPQEMLSKVFDMFTQVGSSIDRSQGGLGIGLTLVRKLVEMHAGSVTAESKGAGQGSTFTVRIPAVAAEIHSPSRPEIGKGVEKQRATGRRILVVDDNVDGAESLAMLLSMAGHELQTAHTGPSAIEAARSFRPEMVFLDIGLPGMNGYEVAKQLRADPAHHGIVLVALTGWGTEEDRRRAKETGFDDHLTKPVEHDRVSAVISKYSPLL